MTRSQFEQHVAEALKTIPKRFRDAMQLNANECLVPSEFRNKLRLVLLKF